MCPGVRRLSRRPRNRSRRRLSDRSRHGLRHRFHRRRRRGPCDGGSLCDLSPQSGCFLGATIYTGVTCSVLSGVRCEAGRPCPTGTLFPRAIRTPPVNVSIPVGIDVVGLGRCPGPGLRTCDGSCSGGGGNSSAMPPTVHRSARRYCGTAVPLCMIDIARGTALPGVVSLAVASAMPLMIPAVISAWFPPPVSVPAMTDAKRESSRRIGDPAPPPVPGTPAHEGYYVYQEFAAGLYKTCLQMPGYSPTDRDEYAE